MKLNVTFSGDQTNRRSEKKEEFIKGGYDTERRQYRPKQVPAPSSAKAYDVQREIQTQGELAIMQMGLFNQLVGAKCATISNKLAPIVNDDDLLRIIKKELYHDISVLKSNNSNNFNTAANIMYITPFKSIYDFVLLIQSQFVRSIRSTGDSIGIDDIKYLNTLIFDRIQNDAQFFVTTMTNAVFGYIRFDEFLVSTEVTTLNYTIQILSEKMKEIIGQGIQTLGYEFDCTVIYNTINEYFDIHHEFIQFYKEVIDEFKNTLPST